VLEFKSSGHDQPCKSWPTTTGTSKLDREKLTLEDEVPAALVLFKPPEQVLKVSALSDQSPLSFSLNAQGLPRLCRFVFR
jgi:hypothetical protein